MGNLRKFRRQRERDRQEQLQQAASQVWDEMLDIDVGMPFDKDSALWMLWLYPSEWSFLFTLAAALQEADLIARDQPSLQRIWIDAIDYVQRDCGYELEGLKLSADRELFPKVKEPLAEANIFSIKLLHMLEGNPQLRFLTVDVPGHARTALEFARQKVPGLDIQILEDFMRWCEETEREARATTDDIPDEIKQELAEIERLRAQYYRENPHRRLE